MNKSHIKPSSYHNTLIVKDCLEIHNLEEIDRSIAEDGRYTFDKNGNITAIDGREVIGGSCTYSLK